MNSHVLEAATSKWKGTKVCHLERGITNKKIHILGVAKHLLSPQCFLESLVFPESRKIWGSLPHQSIQSWRSRSRSPAPVAPVAAAASTALDTPAEPSRKISKASKASKALEVGLLSCFPDDTLFWMEFEGPSVGGWFLHTPKWTQKRWRCRPWVRMRLPRGDGSMWKDLWS